MTEWLYYYAYGSNMDKEQMEERKIEFVPERLKGLLKNWQLVFNKKRQRDGAGVGNLIPKDDSLVEGIIYKINRESMKELDKAEGAPTHHYFRWYLDVETDDSKFLMCVVYIANPERVVDGLKPTKEYLSHYLAGWKFLSDGYLLNLEKIQTSG